MTKSIDTLFRPFTINGLRLPNRTVMAPMTRYFSPGGTPGANVAAYYRRRAENQCGLVITEGTWIDSQVASGYPNVPNFYGEALAGWKHVLDEVHGVNGRIIPQLWHTGMQRDATQSEHPELPSIGPSGVDKKLDIVAEPMTLGQIREIVDAFARGASDARKLGFDGVEIHGAHGYLIDQFFWEKTNHRADQYGGSIENRARFCVEIVEAMRREVGPSFPIMLRISQWKGHDYNAKLVTSPAELDRFLRPLIDAGVDCFDCSQRRFWEPEFEGSPFNLAGWVKKLSGKPTITVGSVGLSSDFIGGVLKGESSSAASIEALLEKLDRDEFDLVAVGRALLTDPEWVRKIQEERHDEMLSFNPEALSVLY